MQSGDDAVMRWALLSTAAYIGASLVANVMSLRIVKLVGVSIDAGTILYPITFTVRDLLHRSAGKRAAQTVVVATAAANGLMVLAFWAAAALPADPAVGAQRGFGDVLLVTWRIVAASVAAQLLSELTDTEVYQRIADRMGTRRMILRVLGSNAVSIPIDSIVFTVVAFAGSVPFGSMVSIVVANIALKGLCSVVLAPMIYAVPTPRSPPHPDPGGADVVVA
ncbi:MAG: queuosine precursor transporter [Microthrixaceae bacterium]